MMKKRLRRLPHFFRLYEITINLKNLSCQRATAGHNKNYKKYGTYQLL